MGQQARCIFTPNAWKKTTMNQQTLLWTLIQTPPIHQTLYHLPNHLLKQPPPIRHLARLVNQRRQLNQIQRIKIQLCPFLAHLYPVKTTFKYLSTLHLHLFLLHLLKFLQYVYPCHFLNVTQPFRSVLLYYHRFAIWKQEYVRWQGWNVLIAHDYRNVVDYENLWFVVWLAHLLYQRHRGGCIKLLYWWFQNALWKDLLISWHNNFLLLNRHFDLLFYLFLTLMNFLFPNNFLLIFLYRFTTNRLFLNRLRVRMKKIINLRLRFGPDWNAFRQISILLIWIHIMLWKKAIRLLELLVLRVVLVVVVWNFLHTTKRCDIWWR